jgi:hypothetical protein
MTNDELRQEDLNKQTEMEQDEEQVQDAQEDSVQSSDSKEVTVQPAEKPTKKVKAKAVPKKSSSKNGTDADPDTSKQVSLSPEEIAGAENLAKLMREVPINNIKGTGSTQENRCSVIEIYNIAEAVRATHGIAKKSALVGMGELIRRGGANVSTPESFKVTVKCPEEQCEVDISKGELMVLVARHANGKNMRNLAEGMAASIVRNGLFWSTKGCHLPGDLAKKISNRLAFEKQPPLSITESVGCASYAQWLPDLDQLVKSDRIKSLLAKDLELRKQGRGQNTKKVPKQNDNNKSNENKSNVKNKGQTAKGKKKKKKGGK